jgi:deferrochelatase/peroxidase EfeB
MPPGNGLPQNGPPENAPQNGPGDARDNGVARTASPASGQRASRRGLLAAVGGLAASVGTGFTARAVVPEAVVPALKQTEAFWGVHQGGIVTPSQSQTYFAALTDAAARMTAGATAAPPVADLDAPGSDSGDALGLAPARLTVTFGFGAGLFEKDGKDRYGLASSRPAALVDLPRFNGDQLMPARTGGDLSVQACADDPQVAFHAVRQLARLAYDVAEIRWAQSGFQARPATGGTPRNLMGFKDGTQTPAQIDRVVWVGDDGPDWMRGGSYVVVRRIRLALEHWDRTNVGFQEQTMGRHKVSGAPLGLKDEFAPLGLDRTDKDENPIIPENAHVRLANSASNGGAEILRRGYSYNDGVNFTAERWPPWRQGMEYDAGLFFVGYQRDPRTGFIRIFGNMAKFDMLNQFATHTGGGLFACPGGMREGEFVGQRLFASV